jgi:hypothetical protein
MGWKVEPAVKAGNKKKPARIYRSRNQAAANQGKEKP